MANPSFLPTAPSFQNLKIPNYVNPATLNPATQPKLQSPSSAPSVATPEMFPNLTKALGNFGNYLANAGGLFGTPAAKAAGNVALNIGGMFGGPTYKPPTPAVPAVVPPQQSNPATYYNAATGGVVPTPGAKTPTTPLVSLHPDIQAPSGATVNPSTGAAVTPAPATSPAAVSAPDNGGGAAPNPTLIAGSTSSATMPSIPNISGGGAFPITPEAVTPYDTSEYKSAEKAFEESQQLTPEEIANKQSQADLAAAAAAALTNTEKQPIPLEFITGQKRVLQEEATNKSDILKNQAAVLEAQRTGNVSAKKAALDLANAKAGYMKPISVAPGNSIYIPGQGIVSGLGGVGGANGAAVGTTGDPSLNSDATGYGSNIVNGSGGLTQSAIDQAALSLLLTGSLPAGARSSTGIGGLQSTAIKNRAAEMDAGGNIQAHKAQLTALQGSLTKQTDYLNSVQRALTAAEGGGQWVVQNAPAGINTNNSTFLNTKLNELTNAFGDSTEIRAYQSALYEIGNEYAQVFARGGQRSESGNAEAQNIINGNITMKALQKTLDTLQSIGKINLDASSKQVDSINQQINSIIKPSKSGSKSSAPAGSNPNDPYSQW